ncbi:MAG: methyltransferase domain-containing protein [SAR202 cluster bacterium]|nr:methyltransferase domain-containing protein [SAR202 cluster bacterium]
MSGNVVTRTAAEIRHWLRSDWSFDDVAAHWDSTHDYDEQNSKTVSYFRRFVDGLRLSNVAEGGRVLDICARTGNGTLYFAKHGKVGSGVCVEVSQRFIGVGSKRLQEAGVENVRWARLTRYELPFKDAEFDTVLCFETVEHFSQPEKLVAELGRVIKPGGTMILTTPNILWEPIHALAAITGMHHSEGPHRFVRAGRLARMIKSADFRIDKAETDVLVPGGPKPLVNAGDWVEARTRRWLMPMVGLRRMFVCTKL